MVESARIHSGARVSGSHGPLEYNPNGKGKRRRRVTVFGTVIKAVGQHQWEVVFDYNNVAQTVSSKSLKVVEQESGIPLNEQTVSEEVSLILLLNLSLCYINLTFHLYLSFVT